MTKVTFYGWKIDDDTLGLISRMKAALSALATDEVAASLEFHTIDTAAYGETSHDEGWGIAFGKAIKMVSDENGRVLGAPEAELLMPGDTNRSYREAALEVLKTLADHLGVVEKLEEPVESYVETPEGVTVGQDWADIVIPERQIKYLQEIKDLLSHDGKLNGKMVIKKGDQKVEIG